MTVIPISQMESLSEVPSHTIRIWEKRFGVFAPQRSSGNVRYYGTADLKRLMDIAFLRKKGLKISKIASLSNQEIGVLLQSFSKRADGLALRMNRLLVATFGTDVEAFEETLNENIHDAGAEATLTELVVPFLLKMRLVSYKDRTNSTHFVVTVIRRKIMAAIEQLEWPNRDAKSALLFLPFGEHFDLLLLYMNYLLRKAGVKVLYLGTNVPNENIIDLLQTQKTDYLYVYAYNHKYDPSIINAAIQKQLSPTTLFVAMPYSQKAAPARTCRYIHFSEAATVLNALPAE